MFILPILLVGAGITAWAMLAAKKKSQTGSPNSPPEINYPPKDVEAITEWRDVGGGQQARYIRPAAANGFVLALANLKAGPTSQLATPSGNMVCYALVPPNNTGTDVNLPWAGNVAQEVYESGQAVLVSLSVYLNSSMPRFMVTCPLPERANYAAKDKDLSIIADNTQHPPDMRRDANGASPPPTITTTDDHKDPIVVPPGPPGGGSTNPCIDANIDDMNAAIAIAFLNNSTVTAEAYDAAAIAEDAKGHPKLAACCRKRAAEVRSNVVPPIVPPANVVRKYQIKNGDIPYQLAIKYVGDGKRYRDFLKANTNMKEVNKKVPNEAHGYDPDDPTTYHIVTYLEPWYGGLTINWPTDWPDP